jgi:hypothetical protein
MSREFIVVSYIDDAQCYHFSSQLFTDIDAAFKEIASFKKFHKENDSLYEIRMSFYDNENDALEYMKLLKIVNYIENQV